MKLSTLTRKALRPALSLGESAAPVPVVPEFALVSMLLQFWVEKATMVETVVVAVMLTPIIVVEVPVADSLSCACTYNSTTIRKKRTLLCPRPGMETNCSKEGQAFGPMKTKSGRDNY